VLTKLSVTCDNCGAIIHLSGQTEPLETPREVDDAVVNLIMDLNSASVDAKDALRKKRGKTKP
jgi:hypothetical protein